MTDLYENRVENLEDKEDEKNLVQLLRKQRNPTRKGKEMTPVSWSLARKVLKLAVQVRNTAFTV